MPISYPINTPTNIGIANITFMAESAVAVSQSPFTFQQQVVAHPGQRWAASISLPPMKRIDAEDWIAFLLSLKGQTGTFLLGDPNAVAAQGSATTKRNLLRYTQLLTDPSWTAARLTVSSAGTAVTPRGTLPYFQLTCAGTSDPILSQTVTTGLVANRTFTMSFVAWTDAGQPTEAALFFYGATGTEQVKSVILTLTTTPTVYTLTGSFNGAAVSTAVTARIDPKDVPVAGNYIYVTGAQFEESSSVTTYQGVASSYGPFVNGAGQTGATLNISGCSPSVSGFLKAGDYIQLGSGATTQLYKVLTQTDTDASGLAAVDIWPNLRSSPTDASAVVVVNTKGRFRLKENITQWNINEMSTYGITFDCVEAL